MKLSIAAIALLATTTTVNARLHQDDESKKNGELTPQPYWGPSKNMVQRSLASPAIIDIRGDIDRLEAANVTANTAIATANAEIAALQDDVVRLDAEDDTLNGRINETDTAIATAETAISALQDDVVRLDAEDDILHDRINAAGSNITALASRLVEKDDTLHGLIDTANTNIDTANANITALASRLEAAEATITELTSLVRALTQTPTSSPTSRRRIVFVTSKLYTGSQIGGILGADLECQDLAGKAGLSGPFKAWLSDSTGSPAQDFVKSGGPFVMRNDAKVADNWQDLTDSKLDNPISVNENGLGVSSGFVWTGTSETGMPRKPSLTPGDFCNNWTSDTSGSAYIGQTTTTLGGWTSFAGASCGSPVRFYCFEQ